MMLCIKASVSGVNFILFVSSTTNNSFFLSRRGAEPQSCNSLSQFADLTQRRKDAILDFPLSTHHSPHTTLYSLLSTLYSRVQFSGNHIQTTQSHYSIRQHPTTYHFRISLVVYKTRPP